MAAKKKTTAKKASDKDTAVAVKDRPATKKATAKKTTTKTKASTAKKKVTKKLTASKTAETTATKKKVAAKKTTTPKKAVAKKAVAKKKAPAKKPAIVGTVPTAQGGQFKTFVPYEAGADEEYMNPDQEEHFRAILLDWKISLMQEVDRTVGHMKSDATNFPDPNDRATQEEEFSLELRTRDRERKLIKKIDESLTKIDEEEYGYCDGCGVEIGIRRLEARPTANMCIECKTLEEIREKQIA
jgi:DnaK suppressor protein